MGCNDGMARKSHRTNRRFPGAFSGELTLAEANRHSAEQHISYRRQVAAIENVIARCFRLA
jgi:hypothetical protein